MAGLLLGARELLREWLWLKDSPLSCQTFSECTVIKDSFLQLSFLLSLFPPQESDIHLGLMAFPATTPGSFSFPLTGHLPSYISCRSNPIVASASCKTWINTLALKKIHFWSLWVRPELGQGGWCGSKCPPPGPLVWGWYLRSSRMQPVLSLGTWELTQEHRATLPTPPL